MNKHFTRQNKLYSPGISKKSWRKFQSRQYFDKMIIFWMDSFEWRQSPTVGYSKKYSDVLKLRLSLCNILHSHQFSNVVISIFLISKWSSSILSGVFFLQKGGQKESCVEIGSGRLFNASNLEWKSQICVCSCRQQPLLGLAATYENVSLLRPLLLKDWNDWRRHVTMVMLFWQCCKIGLFLHWLFIHLHWRD